MFLHKLHWKDLFFFCFLTSQFNSKYLWFKIFFFRLLSSCIFITNLQYCEISIEFMQDSLNNVFMQNSWDLNVKMTQKKFKLFLYKWYGFLNLWCFHVKYIRFTFKFIICNYCDVILHKIMQVSCINWTLTFMYVLLKNVSSIWMCKILNIYKYCSY
jgi:hypothetical protein